MWIKHVWIDAIGDALIGAFQGFEQCAVAGDLLIEHAGAGSLAKCLTHDVRGFGATSMAAQAVAQDEHGATGCPEPIRAGGILLQFLPKAPELWRNAIPA